MHRFRLADFDHHFRVTSWDALPPIAAHIRWLKRRLEGVLPRQLWRKEETRLLQLWDALVDEESLTWRYGNSPHGWYTRYPDCAKIGEVLPRYEDGETFGVASRTGTEVMTFAQRLTHREREALARLSGGRFGRSRRSDSDEQGDTDIDPADVSSDELLSKVKNLVHLLGVVAARRVQDAELLLLRTHDPQGAWHLVSEALELVNRGERIALIEAITEQRAEIQRPDVTEIASPLDGRAQTASASTKGRFYIAEDGTVLVELFNSVFSSKIRSNSKGGLRCIQAILKSPTRSLLNEILALEYAGYKPIPTPVEKREMMIEPDEYRRLLEKKEEVDRKKKTLDPDLDDYDKQLACLDEELKDLARDISNRTHAGRPKLKRGPIEERQRNVGAIIRRAVNTIMRSRKDIGLHLNEALKGLNTATIYYCPSEPVEWEFGPPDLVQRARIRP